MAEGAARRLPGLDLLRALAIAWVMLYHLESLGPRLPGPLVAYGWMGVDLFFVLSGYLIGWQVLRPLTSGARPAWWPWWQDFMLRRALRILPAYLAVLALYLLLPAWSEAESMRPVWQFLSFTVNLLPADLDQRAFSHAWSLCVEEHFYLLLPLVVWLLARRPGIGKSLLLAIGVLLGGMLLRAWLWQHELAPVQGTADYFERFVGLIYFPTPTRLDGLLAGTLLAALRAFRPGAWSVLQSHGWLLLCAGLLGVAGVMWLMQGVPGFAGIVFGYPLLAWSFACLLVACSSRQTWPVRVPGVQLLATLAFCLYLTHKQVFHVVSAWLGDSLDGLPLAAFGVYLGAALLAAYGLHVLVERPGLRWREHLQRRQQLAGQAGTTIAGS
ncbi:acyltransferase family protein [Janthinobacterium aquaticum]|uniref:acyltransferase family protein n=1 Tax=Janthinobacterium sp. FT58W TaxID=2654254 RepID=UPI001D029C92|nr:acyltransferase [Janthinobacterium sp. FT58W]